MGAASKKVDNWGRGGFPLLHDQEHRVAFQPENLFDCLSMVILLNNFIL